MFATSKANKENMIFILGENFEIILQNIIIILNTMASEMKRKCKYELGVGDLEFFFNKMLQN